MFICANKNKQYIYNIYIIYIIYILYILYILYIYIIYIIHIINIYYIYYIYIYDSQIVHHNPCFNLFILHNNSFDNHRNTRRHHLPRHLSSHYIHANFLAHQRCWHVKINLSSVLKYLIKLNLMKFQVYSNFMSFLILKIVIKCPGEIYLYDNS